MPAYNLSKTAIALISRAVDKLFDRAKARLIGPHMIDKYIAVEFVKELSIPGVYEAASREHNSLPNQDTIDTLTRVTQMYLDATKDRTKAKVISSIQKTLRELSVQAPNKVNPTNVRHVMNRHLSEVWKDVSNKVETIVDTEVHVAKNVSTMEAIVKTNINQGVSDPVVYFIVTHDKHLCGECSRLHLLKDGVTPRLWYMSEIGHGYHKVGDPNPKIGGLHPHCRCTLLTCLPGYGFDAAGNLQFIALNHSEIDKQRGKKKAKKKVVVRKSEDDGLHSVSKYGMKLVDRSRYPMWDSKSGKSVTIAPEHTLLTTQTHVHPELVEQYRQRIRAGERPVVEIGIVRDKQDPKKGHRWLYDGHHKLAAYRAEGIHAPGWAYEVGQDAGGEFDAPKYKPK